MEVTNTEKHSSLFQDGINYGRKNFVVQSRVSYNATNSLIELIIANSRAGEEAN
jgi:hypothetical protein